MGVVCIRVNLEQIERNACGELDRPIMVLKKPHGEMIGSLGYYFNLQMDLKYNETSQISFEYPKRIDGKSVPFYDEIVGGKLLQVDPYGVFVVSAAEESGDGIKKVKEVTAQSLEYELADKRVVFAEGTYNLWNPADVENTLLGMLLSGARNWSIGSVSPSMIGKYRAFSQTDSKLLSFLMDTVQKTYGCIFVFDTYNRVIDVIDAEEDIVTAPVYLSYQNLIEEDKLSEDTSTMFTKLLVSGADGIDIRNVNPTGDGYIYNINYYIENGDIPSGLASKWRTWQNEIFVQQPYYTSLVALRNSTMAQYITENAKLTDLNNSLSTLDNTRATFTEMLKKEDLHEFNREYFEQRMDEAGTEAGELERKIYEQVVLLNGLQDEYNGYSASISAINHHLSIAEYFSQEELDILDYYLKEDSFTDSTFAVFNVDITDGGQFSSLDSITLQFSDVTWVDIPCEGAEHAMASVTGGRISASGDGVSVVADIIDGTVDHSNGYVVCSLYLGSGTINGESFPSGNLSCVGSSVFDDASILSAMVKEPHTITSDDGTVSHTMYYYKGSPVITLQKSDSASGAQSSFYFTRNVTEYQRYSVEQELYDYASECMKDISCPTYSFEIECGNILYDHKFKPFKDAIQLGCAVYLQLDEDHLVQPMLLEIHINFEKPDDFSLVFSNEFKRPDKVQSMKDTLSDAKATSKSIDMSKYQFAENRNTTSWVQSMIQSGYDAAMTRIMAGPEQCVTIDKAGIVIDSYVETVEGPGGVETTKAVDKIILTNGMIALVERDESGKETVRMAMGHFYDGNLGSDFVGVLADVICGTLVAGQNLVIECPDPNGGIMQFKVDSSGVIINGGRMYMKNEKGAMGWDAAHGFFAGTSSLFDYTDSGYVKPVCIDEDGNLILDDGGFPKDTNVWIGIDGQAYFRGTVYAVDGDFIGDVHARNFYFQDGDSVKTLLDQATKKFDLSELDYIDLGGIQLDGVTGNINFSSAGSITWGNNAPVKYQFAASSSGSWHDTMQSGDKYRRDSLDGGTTWGDPYQFLAEDGQPGSDASVTRNNIARAMLSAISSDGLYSQTIDGQTCLLINASAIKSGVIEGIDIYGGSYYDINGKTRLVLNPNNSSSSYADLCLYSGSSKAFQIYDNVGSVSMYAYSNEFLASGDLGGTYAIGAWDFSSATVTGITATFG